ncbi:MAG: cellulose binding domain-containing protein, partial [Gammaproteobacteria bacterium]
VTANGVSWNKQLDPGASANFGFCAQRPPSSPPSSGTGNVDAGLTIQSDWGNGYCADVKVKNLGDAAVQWEVSLEIEGHANNVWNAVYSQNGAILSANGVDWNSWIPAGGETSFGFCASR